jgi:hypothetical protein
MGVHRLSCSVSGKTEKGMVCITFHFAVPSVAAVYLDIALFLCLRSDTYFRACLLPRCFSSTAFHAAQSTWPRPSAGMVLLSFLNPLRREIRFSAKKHSVSHIVKVSHEQWADRGELSPCETNWLLIKTLGREGLRFLSRLPLYHSSGWQYVPGFPISNYKDTAGAGDWCTAGILAYLGTQGAKGLEHVGEREIQDALRQGQLLASWNCGFEGARGGMYVKPRHQLKKLALGIALPPPSD